MNLHILVREIDGVPAEFQLLPYGEITFHDKQKAIIDDEAMASIIARFLKRGNDMVIDYEHQTEKGGEAPAAGWIKTLANRGREGLWAVVEWTEKAKEYLKNREYRYFSPVMWTGVSTKRVMVIDSVALTNFPGTDNLKPIMAKMETALAAIGHDPNEEAKGMEKILEMLKLAGAPASDKAEDGVALVILKCADLETKLAEASTQAADAAKIIACKEVLTALGADEKATAADLVKIVAGMKALETPAAKLAAKVTELELKLIVREQDDLVQEALKTGRISPAELKDWGSELAKNAPEQFRKIVLARQPGSVIPLDKLSMTHVKTGDLPDEVQKTINKQMGLSDDDFKKFGPEAEQ